MKTRARWKEVCIYGKRSENNEKHVHAKLAVVKDLFLSSKLNKRNRVEITRRYWRLKMFSLSRVLGSKHELLLV